MLNTLSIPIPTMVGVFRRSLSFPNKPAAAAAAARQPKPPISRHLRSVSLPCRSHPLISSLKDQIAALKSWPSDGRRTSAWLCRGLAALKLAHDYLDDILQLPQSRESMCRLSPARVEKLLEDFLRFIDAYGVFQNLILALREDHVAAHVAIRRKDAARLLEAYSKARKRTAKESGRLVPKVAGEQRAVSGVDDELAAAIGEVMEVTGVVSAAVFKGIEASWGGRRGWPIGKKKRNGRGEGIVELVEVGGEAVKVTVEKMKELEECIGCIESGTDKVFRSLINTRVSILNALSH